MYSRDDVVAALNNKDEFKQLIRSFYTLRGILKQYPEYQDEFADLILKSPRIFKEFIGNQDGFDDLMQALPKYENQLVEIIFSQAILLERLSYDFDSLKSFCDAYPTHADRFIRYIINDYALLVGLVNRRVLGSINLLGEFAKHFPFHKYELLKVVLESPIASLDPVLSSLPSRLQVFFKNSDDILSLHYSLKEDDVKIILMAIFSNVEEPIRLIESAREFWRLIEAYPAYAGIMLNKLFIYPVFFQQIIVDDAQFSTLKMYVNELKKMGLLDNKFKHDDILNQGSAIEALKKIKDDYQEIISATSFLVEMKLQKPEVFSGLSLGLIARIAGTVSTSRITQVDAEKIGMQYLTRPLLSINNLDELIANDASSDLVKDLLLDSNQFKRLIKNYSDLQQLAKAFPEEPILKEFESNSTLENEKAYSLTISSIQDRVGRDVFEKMRARKYARILGQGARDVNSLFSTIPIELHIKVILEAVRDRWEDVSQLSKKEGAAIVCEHLDKPIVKPKI